MRLAHAHRIVRQVDIAIIAWNEQFSQYFRSIFFSPEVTVRAVEGLLLAGNEDG